jgi:hypothetical protein
LVAQRVGSTVGLLADQTAKLSVAWSVVRTAVRWVPKKAASWASQWVVQTAASWVAQKAAVTAGPWVVA